MNNCPKCGMPLSDGEHILETPFGSLIEVPCGLVHTKTFKTALREGIKGTAQEKFFAKYLADREPWPVSLKKRQDAAIKEALEIINEN